MISSDRFGVRCWPAIPPRRTPIRWLLVLVAAVLAGCDQSAPWQRDVYVWQRVWTPAVVDAVEQASPHVDRFRILTAQWRVGDAPVVVDLVPGREAFAGQQLVPVVRLDGTRLAIAPKDVAAMLDEQIAMFEAAGAMVISVKIDHDAATAAVGDYADWLARLRAELPDDLALWITTLPDWRHSPDIAQLLNGVDAYTLQVHAVTDNGAKLMDTELALDWVQAFDQLSRTDFYAALPNYQLRAGLDESGERVFLEGEAEVAATAAIERSLFVAPGELAEWISRLSLNTPRSMAGLVWFRLPVAGDRNNIGLQTLNALLNGDPLSADVRVLASRISEDSSNFDLWVANHGPHDGGVPSHIYLPSACLSGAGVNGFDYLSRPARLVVDHPGLLRAGKRLVVGWVRCPGMSAADFNLAFQGR